MTHQRLTAPLIALLLLLSLTSAACTIQGEDLQVRLPASSSGQRLLSAASQMRLSLTGLENCSPRSEWPVYVLQADETLPDVAERIDSSTPLLAVANCLNAPDEVGSGDVLYVPRLPSEDGLRPSADLISD